MAMAGVTVSLALSASPPPAQAVPAPVEKTVTRDRRGHILTNFGVWSPDSEWIVYDTRPDRAGEQFSGRTIERVNIHTGEVQVLYTSRNGAHCGVVTHHPTKPEVVFILGPERPTPDWAYCAWHRQGVLVDYGTSPPAARNLDARDLTPPFTPGALRGGSHVHVFSPDGAWVSFTYEDHVLAAVPEPTPDHDVNLRGVGVSVPAGPVRVPRTHPRNHDGAVFSVLVTRTMARPKPGSDDIQRACEEGWIGTNGYLKADGTRQRRALAFQGQVVAESGQPHSEVFVVDLPDDLTVPGDSRLCGTERRAPAPPKGCLQRRLTRTADRKSPGLQGPRHWLRSSPDGARIAFLMKDDEGIVQLWTVSPNGGPPVQVTRNPWSVASAFSWSPDGRRLAHVMDGSVFVTEVDTVRSTRLTPRTDPERAPRPEACVFSPDGRKIAFVRPLREGDAALNQVCVLFVER